MYGKMHPGSIVLLALLLLAPQARAQEGGEDYASTKLSKELREKLEKKRKELADQDAQKIKAFREDLDKKLKEVLEKQREVTVEFHGQAKNIPVPGSPAKVDDIVREPYNYWTLAPRDFRFELPVEIFVPRLVGPKSLIGKDKVYLVLPFTLTNTMIQVVVKDKEDNLLNRTVVNSQEELAKLKKVADGEGWTVTAKPIAGSFSPRFTMVTDKGVFTPEVSGFLAREAVEFSTFKKRAWTQELIGYAPNSQPVGEFKPGETKAGVTVFPRYDVETTSVRIIVDGLSNDYRFKKDLRKVLVLEFVRPGNVFYPGQVKLAFKRCIGDKLMDPKSGYIPKRDEDVHHGFDWVWLWNWDGAISASDPKRTADVPSPIGKDKFNFWTYTVKVPNRTGKDQPLTISRVDTLVRVKLDIQGAEREIEVPLVDDGKMNVYKAAFFDSEGLVVAGERFPQKKRVEPGEDRAAEFTVCFRERDVDFATVLRNIHDALALELAVERNKLKPRERAVYSKTPQLSAAEVASVRDQLAKKLPAALQAQLSKKVVAEITGKSGLASGKRVGNFSLFKPVPVPED